MEVLALVLFVVLWPVTCSIQNYISAQLYGVHESQYILRVIDKVMDSAVWIIIIVYLLKLINKGGIS